MIDALVQIPGPTFLWMFSVYALVLIVLARMLTAKDNSLNYPMPEPSKIDPVDMALLRGGVKSAVLNAVFNLWRQKALDVVRSKKSIQVKKKHIDSSLLSPLEKEIYHSLKEPLFYKQLFAGNRLSTAERLLEANINKLLQLQLLADNETKRQRVKTVWLFTALLFAVGGTKLYYGIINDRPVVFLVVLLVVFWVVGFMAIAPGSLQQSALGRKFLEQSRTRFEWLKKAENANQLLYDNNLLYGIALFGFSAFAGTALGNELNTAAIAGYDTSFWAIGSSNGCSGCGTGCSGCSGGTNTSGCSGDSGSSGCSSGCSGCGGGGCGGCGG